MNIETPTSNEIDSPEDMENNEKINRIKAMFNTEPSSFTSMSEEEKLTIGIDLQKYHTIFKKFWQVASIQFTNTIPTACVFPISRSQMFRNSDALIGIYINPKLWEASTHIQKLWLICHECLHAVLDHFTRGYMLEHKQLANCMMDIVINHTTIEKLGFKRSEVDPENVYCWMDKFFKPEDNVPHGMNFEYYYNEILTRFPDRGNNAKLLDDHSFSEMSFEDFIKSMDGILTDKEKEYLKDWIQKNAQGSEAGTGRGAQLWTFGGGPVKKKKKWESVIKNWVVKVIGFKQKNLDQWVHQNRRMGLLPKNLALPFEYEQDTLNKKKEKKQLFFFQDASGSCWDYAERFFVAARSIPTEKFDIHLFSFDTAVYAADINEGKIEGGGGTAFDIIEAKVQEVIKDKTINYKSDIAVWVLSDGMGGPVEPEYPENWYWFLTSKTDPKTYIHPKSHIYYLDDYE